jgi:hypothetical protein
LDEFGNLISKWDVQVNNYNARSASTCLYVRIDRDEIQIRRRRRLKNLASAVRHALEDFDAGRITLTALNVQISEWLAEPFQADVADYFLRGPGRITAPFSNLLSLGVTIPLP